MKAVFFEPILDLYQTSALFPCSAQTITAIFLSKNPYHSSNNLLT